ncbi:MAG TPA: hypothetical protein V6D47_13990 [Oscillatoriaceae cyanobacterium]
MIFAPVRNREDFDALFGQMASFGRALKKKHRDMMPFAMTMGQDGEVAMVGSIGEDTHEILENLKLALTQVAREGRLKAVGICYDGLLRGPDGAAHDALMFELEHQIDEAVKMFIPYETALFGGVRFGAPGRIAAHSSFFSPCEPRIETRFSSLGKSSRRFMDCAIARRPD